MRGGFSDSNKSISGGDFDNGATKYVTLRFGYYAAFGIRRADHALADFFGMFRRLF
ncbi:MAG: hypothetical protein V4657_07350 [Pseudomonadota bacterium]